jgi:hypothetical protein
VVSAWRMIGREGSIKNVEERLLMIRGMSQQRTSNRGRQGVTYSIGVQLLIQVYSCFEIVHNFYPRSMIRIASCIKGTDTRPMLSPLMHPEMLVRTVARQPVGTHEVK